MLKISLTFFLKLCFITSNGFIFKKYNQYNYYSKFEYKPSNIKIISQSEVDIETECFSESNIKNVEIEGSIIKLKERSFDKCINLETITISNSKEIIIDKFTFNECQNLKNITLKASKLNIGENQKEILFLPYEIRSKHSEKKFIFQQ